MFNESAGIKSSDNCIETITLMVKGDLAQNTFMGYNGAGQSRMPMYVGYANPRVNTRLYKIFSTFLQDY